MKKHRVIAFLLTASLGLTPSVSALAESSEDVFIEDDILEEEFEEEIDLEDTFEEDFEELPETIGVETEDSLLEEELEIEEEYEEKSEADIDSGKCGDHLTWTLDDHGVLTISGQGNMYDYYEDNAPWADYWDVNRIEIKEGVTSIGDYAFWSNGAYGIELPESLTSIGKYAFENSLISRISIPANVTAIGWHAFADCNLEEMYIQGMNTELEGVFEFSDRLSVYCMENSKASNLYTLGLSKVEVIVVDKEKLEYMNPRSGFYGDNIRWEIDENGVLTLSGIGVADIGFYWCPWEAYMEDITELVVEDGITNLSPDITSSFRDTITRIKIAETVEEIPISVFYINSLEELYVYGKDTTVDYDSLCPSGCTLYCLDNSEALKTFSQINKNYVIMDLDPCLQQKGMWKDNIQWTLDKQGVLRIMGDGEMAVNYARSYPWGHYQETIKAIIVEEGITSIAYYAFEGCINAKSLKLPSSVKTINENAFIWCSGLEEIDFSEGLNRIEEDAFFNLGSKLKSITFPESLEYIGPNAFGFCPGLEKLEFLGKEIEIEYNAFDNEDIDCEKPVIYCYRKSDPFFYAKDNGYKYIYLDPDNSYAKDHCGENLTWELDCEGTLIISGCGPMYDYNPVFDEVIPWDEIRDQVKKVVLPEGLTYITSFAFSDFKQITEIEIPDTVTSINNAAFNNCVRLQSITVPDSVTEMGHAVFNDCVSLKSAKLSDNMTYVDSNMFYGCTSLQKVELPKKLETMGAMTFEGCRSLKSIDLPEGLTDLLYFNFYGDGLLERVDLPSTLNYIGDGVFDQCPKLTSVYCYAKKTDISIFAFGYGAISSKLTIYCMSGSDMLKYAQDKKINYVILDKAPSMTGFSMTENGITVEWSEMENAIGYKVFKNGEEIKEITKGSTVNYTDTCVKNGDTPKYTVKAVYNFGADNVVSPDSEEMKAVFLTAPSISSVLSEQVEQIKVTWNKNTSADGYQLKYVLDDVTKTTSVTGADTVTTILSGLTSGKTYDIQIRSYKTMDGSKCYSAWSSVKSATVTKGLAAIELNASKITLKRTKTYQLTATVTPADAENKDVTWKSSNTNVAEVSNTGKVTALCPGTATITCTAKDGSGVKAVCTIQVEALDDVEAFVTRLYQTCLDRNPDPVGLNDWTTKLKKQEVSGVAIASGFVFSNEFQNKNYNDADYVEHLYRAFMGRPSDKNGKQYWINNINHGMTRQQVFDGFAASKEFIGLCDQYGIVWRSPENAKVTSIKLNVSKTTLKRTKTYQLTATVTPADAENKDVTWKSSNTNVAEVSSTGKVTAICPGTATITCTAKDGSGVKAVCTVQVEALDDVEAFVTRLYQTCLDRNPDLVGLNDWTTKLKKQQISGKSAASLFVFSREFENRRYNDDDYVEHLYRAIMGRPSDKGGKQYWINNLNKGMTRQQVFDGFAASKEFADICKQYGIKKD